MKRSLRLLVVALVVSSCWWTPLHGPNFGPLGAFFRKEGLPEVPHRTDRPVFRVILVGDGGAPLPEDPTLALVGKWGDELPGRTEVVFLGDNVYPAGLQAANPNAKE